MKNLKVRTKLLALVAFMLAAVIVMGVLAIYSMGSINEGSTVLATNWLPSVITAQELNTLTSDFRIREYGHMVSTDATAMQNYETQMDEISQSIDEAFAEYNTLTTNEVDGALIANAKAAWDKYLVANKRVVELSRQNKTEEAMAAMQGDSADLFTGASDIFLEIVNFNRQGGEQASLDGDETYSSSRSIMIGSIVVVSVLSVGFAIIILAGVLRPISEIDSVARKIADGNLDMEITYRSKDELGVLAVNFNKTVDRLREYVNYIDEVSGVLDEIADGNLVFELTYDYAGEFAKVKTALLNISDSLNNTMSHISQTADQVASGSGQVSSGAQALSQGATEQASAIEELSASIAEISEQVKNTANNANMAREQAGQAGSSVQDSNEQMQRMIAAMNDISQKSSDIGKIIKTIDDIAFQTNILALNAAVEAARAGAAGKGFAVVADEVRSLAGKSAEAAKNTTALIEETVAAVENGTQIADGTAQAMLTVVEGTTAVTKLIAEIADASDEQANSISQVTMGVDQISSVVQTNSATAEESAAASEELSAQSEALRNLVSRFVLRDSVAEIGTNSF